METNTLQTNWNKMRHQIKQWWGDLTDEDLDTINGDEAQLITTLQERYGYTRNLAFVEVKIRMLNYDNNHRKNIRASHIIQLLLNTFR